MWSKKIVAVFAGLSGLSGLVQFSEEKITEALSVEPTSATLLMPARHDNVSWKNKADDMVDNYLVTRGIKDSALLSAMRKIPRHKFIPGMYFEDAYEDRILPIGKGQTISSPYMVALMTEFLGVTKEDTVLEIGTGSGYQSAVLSLLSAKVYSVELLKHLADSAAYRLKNLGYHNVHVKSGDGYKGWKEHGPYDKIIVTAAPPTIPGELVAQLKSGGKMVVPVGDIGSQFLLVITKNGDDFTFERKKSVSFVPMRHNK